MGRKRCKTKNVNMAMSVGPETKQLILGIRHSESFPEVSRAGRLLDSIASLLAAAKDDAAFARMASANLKALSSYLKQDGQTEAAKRLGLLASVALKINGAELEERDDWRYGPQPKTAKKAKKARTTKTAKAASQND